MKGSSEKVCIFITLQDQQRREVAAVRNRLDDLADSQQRQAESLLGMSELTTRTNLYEDK